MPKLTSKSKKMTLEALARMVAKGFENTASKEEAATKQDLSNLEKRIDAKIEKLERNLKQEIQSLRNSVNNYLRLSDKRYLEIRNNERVLAKYLKLIILKSKIQIDTRELETILK